MRIGIFQDSLYRRDGAVLSNSRAFTRFLTGLPGRVDEVVLFGRVAPEPGRSDYVLPATGIRFVALPHYASVGAVIPMLRAMRQSMVRFAAELERLDAVWIFGPHPMAIAFSLVARRRGTPLFLGVRQDYPAYIANRLPGRAWRWAVVAARALEAAFRYFGRRAPAVVLGEELARSYAGGAPVLTTGFSLVRADELVPAEVALAKPWDGRIELLSVGRLDPEKNPLLLAEVMRLLAARPGRWRLTVVGDGPVRAALETRVRELGVDDAVEIVGAVPNGPALWERYRRSHAFVHVSLTEGLPQVLSEAQAAGLPVVATAVGGVASALGHGASGLLVPPRDAGALAAAIRRLDSEPGLRERLIRSGLRDAADQTMDAQLDRLVAFVADCLDDAAADGSRDAAGPVRSARRDADRRGAEADEQP
jgi:glycosyltransferase involved in cell wall biosynthesis